MTGFIPKEKLSAYQRWEVAAFDEAEQAAARAQEAEAIAEEPQVESEPVILPTAADIERMHIEAHQQGYDAGYAEGMTKAQDCASRIDAVMLNLQQALSELDQHVAEQILATAIEVANQMLRQTLRLKPELLLPVIKEAVATLHQHSGHPALFVNPDDAALIRSNLGDQLSHNNWRIIEDDTLSTGGCRVEVGASEVDATMETRWRRVLESIGINQDWLIGKP